MDMVTQLSLLKQIYSERTLWDEELQASRHVVPDSLSVKDREALEAAGHEPNRFVRPQHDETITELKKVANQWTINDAAQAFVSSLWSAPMI
ncbi:hypothetical protein ACH0BY_15440 [Paenibacillus amylolyticus]|uniref:hypothetical protein n=2 Tax=Paenibacillus TaxID=44249 RepID=UPI003879F27B